MKRGRVVKPVPDDVLVTAAYMRNQVGAEVSDVVEPDPGDADRATRNGGRAEAVGIGVADASDVQRTARDDRCAKGRDVREVGVRDVDGTPADSRGTERVRI